MNRRSHVAHRLGALTALALGMQAWAVVLPVSARAGVGAIPYQVGTAKGVTFRGLVAAAAPVVGLR